MDTVGKSLKTEFRAQARPKKHVCSPSEVRVPLFDYPKIDLNPGILLAGNEPRLSLSLSWGSQKVKPKCDCTTKNLEPRRNCYQQFKTGDGVQKFHCKETKERPPKEPSHGCLFRRPPNWLRFSWAFLLVFLLAPFARAGFSVWFFFRFGTLLTWKLTDWWAVVPSHPPKKGRKKDSPNRLQNAPNSQPAR